MKSLSLRPIGLLDLQSIARDPDQVEGQYFYDDVDIYRIYGDGNSKPCASLLRFQKDGHIPLHEHIGYEHLYILSGSQTDDQGTARAGSLIINPPGTRHSVTSESGCIVLEVYEKPVAFL